MAAVSIESGQKLQFLTFTLNGAEYAVQITDIQEVRAWEGVNALPRTPKYVAGIINLRDNVIPIIDLRLRLNLEQREYDDKTVVAIIKIRSSESEQLVGIVVDSVSDVLNTTTDRISSVPDFGNRENNEIINGLISQSDKMVILLDTSRLISQTELVNLDSKIKMYGAMAGNE